MIDDGQDLLVRGLAAADAGERSDARRYLELCLLQDPSMEIRIRAWRRLVEVSDDPARKRDYIGRVLAVDPTDGTARRALAILDGRLDPAEIVNPERAKDTTPTDTATNTVERLSCPRCGSSRLVADGDGRILTCEHCHYTEPIDLRSDQTVPGRDFTATMWTARGHRAPDQTPTFACGTCGASYILASDVHSVTCAFCGAVYVNVEAVTREVLTPDALLPFATEPADARRSLEEAAVTVARDPRPIFLPAWLFSFAGSVLWTGYDRNDRRGDSSQRTPRSGEFPVINRLALVCASTELPDSLHHLVDEFDISALIPYDPRQLAGRLAAAWQISLDDASVAARRKIRSGVRADVKEELPDVSEVQMTFTRVGVDTFKLVLLPFWIAEDRHRIFINGQHGRLGRPADPPGLLSRLGLAGW